jgi:hypothetical protein
LGPADQGKQAEHHDVIEHFPVRIDDRQGYGGHRQRHPSRADRQQQARALAVGKRRFGKFQRGLSSLGSPDRRAAEIGNVAGIGQYAQNTHS